MPVRAIYYWDCETKPIVSNDRYRYTFHQTYCLGRQVSIDLSPNLLFRKIGIDRPFTTLLFRTIGIDRPFTILLFRMIGIGTQTFRHFTVSVLESNAARRQPVSVQSTLVRHSSSTPHATPAQRRIPEYEAVCPGCALRSLRWMVSTTRWCEAQACSVLERPVCMPFSSFFYPG